MKRLSIFALALVLVSVVSAFGQETNRTLTSKNNGDWDAGNASIWNGLKGKPFNPTLDDDVTIISPHTIDIADGYTALARNLTIQEGGTLNNNGQHLTVTYDITIAGTLNNNGEITANEVLTIDNGTLNNQTNGIINADVSISGGTLTNSGTIDGDLTIGGGVVNLNQGSSITGTITINGGTVNIAAGAVVDFSGATISESATINITSGAVLIGYSGQQSISIPLKGNKWNFIGFPHVENISPLAATDAPAIWALAFDYTTNDWTENYLHWIEGGQKDELPYGEGIFAWAATDYTINASAAVSNENRTMNYNSIAGSDADGRWFALANPFSFQLDIEKFLNGNIGIQGGCVYIYNGSTFNENVISGTINVGQGFFVNMLSNGGQIQFNNTQYSTPTAKSKSAEREFVRVSVATEGYKVPVMFAQNDDASDGYDIFDANKMFGDGSVAEPYLICNGINLCKEEVSSANYTATMNIKSFESRSVDIVADNIPEGYSLTLIDGAMEVVMNQGDVYTTNIAEGENADRFKLLITKNNVSIADVAEAESIRVVNNNRTIRVYGGKSVRTEVYNALGQKVYETSDRAFDLNNVASGAYVLRVQDGKSVNSTKIVVE